jgi:hypothetical protein
MRFQSHVILSTLVISCVLSGCQKKQIISKRGSSTLTVDNYGGLPLLPAGQKPANSESFISQLTDGWEAKPMFVNAQSKIALGTDDGNIDMQCDLTQNTALDAVAEVVSDRGNRYTIVHLKQPCAAYRFNNSTNSASFDGQQILEGYVESQHLSQAQVAPTAKSENQADFVIGNIDAKDQSGGAIVVNKSAGCQSSQLILGSRTNTPSECDGTSGTCMTSGSYFREPVSERLFLVVRGGADKFALSLTNKDLVTDPNLINNTNPRNTSVLSQKVIEAEQFLKRNISEKDTDATDPVYVIPFASFLDKNNWRSARISIKIEARNSADQKIGAECEKNFQLTSPIVLTFDSHSKPKLFHPLEKNIQFDLNGDGVKERTGWIHPSSGFLVMDKNGNGAIDDGREMFGEHTSGKSFANGYLALKELDQGLGYIDAKNPSFTKLKVWFDHNLDGKSQPEEIKSLESLMITRIDTQHTALDDKAGALDNRILFAGKFYGPKSCGTTGCNSHDVFFSTISDVASKK